MPFKNDLATLIDQNYRSKSFREIAGASPGVMGGLSYTEAAKLMEALDVKTIDELASNRYVLWAQSISHLAKYEKAETGAGQAFHPNVSAILDARWEKKSLRELATASPSIFTGLTDIEAKLLAESLQVQTVEDLATNRFVLLAQVIAHLAKYEPVKITTRQVISKAA